jgi:hypothetical protein
MDKSFSTGKCKLRSLAASMQKTFYDEAFISSSVDNNDVERLTFYVMSANL